MIGKSDIIDMKKNIETCIGQNITIKANIGRNRIVCKTGIVEKAYQNLFVVKVDETNNNVSYSYTDLLTNMLEIGVPKNEQIIGCVSTGFIHDENVVDVNNDEEAEIEL